ncbi:MAG TPA: thioredoxin family protein [Noviherbaspirillum sp.]|nr:thioredoxin family protein [Noviherbaspirillum sp.]
MAMNDTYATMEPKREEIDALAGPAVVEFGAPWCGYCIRAQSLIAEAFAGHAGVRHIKIEDGPGRRLGRSYRIKLWPTLVFLSDGQEVARLVRPEDAASIRRELERIDASPQQQSPSS